MELLEYHRCFGGEQRRYRHDSDTLNCSMDFSVYLPSSVTSEHVPVLLWLSGLTCTDQNFVNKAGAQKYAEEHGIAIVCPDTSPRGDAIPGSPDGSYDLGKGAGFYVNAIREPYATHYQMWDYVLKELPFLLKTRLPLDMSRLAISGHSMGGHGALTMALRHPEQFRSVSAFAPISSPTRCPWGEKAFTAYLGPDVKIWAQYDASLLIAEAEQHVPMLIDQGSADGFMKLQLKPELLTDAAEAAGYPLTFRQQEGYDHSYFFVASFIGEHIAFHARHLAG